MDVSRATTSHDPLKALFDGLKRQHEVSSRAKNYGRQLDAKLASLPTDEARRLLCDDQLQKWIGWYEDFATKVDSGKLEPPENGPDAFDFTMTIAEISARQARYAPVSA